MRKLVVSSLFALAMVSWSGCKESDPNAFETHIEGIRDVNARAASISQLEALVKTVTTAQGDQTARKQEFVDKIVPIFDEVWDQVTPEQQVTMLNMLRDVGRPEGAKLWIRALVLDGSDGARKRVLAALQGIQRARATDATDAVIALFQSLIKDPGKDKGKTNEGEVRLELAKTLGELRDKKGVPVLIESMLQTKESQPVSVHREAAKALGMIKDPAAVDALLTVSFRVPDAPSTTDISNRAKIAVVSIGEPAVPRLKDMLAGKFEEVNKLATDNGVDLLVVQQTAVAILGALGTRSATDELIAFMPQKDCVPVEVKKPDKKKKKKDEEEEPLEDEAADASLRAFVANTLGLIGDPKGVEPMCKCINATHNPGDMFPITEALGRIGGPEAFKCLAEVTKSGEYDPEALENSEFRYQIRWEAARFAILTASPDDLTALQDALKGAGAANDKKVAEELPKWDAGLKVLETCKADKACYLKTLQDQNADWFAREKAAFELARLSPGDKATALELAKAFKVRNPDARVSMALLVTRVLGDAKCPECATALDDVMKGEKGSMDATMQLPVLTARTTIARVAE
ncbi:HEAT repeat domain-containing protein [Nannocystis sp.]|uniref:HEAT repeat domain-containing protein n=1 Tax=Nannocystis sp. TaxID=1962667 RepID=UPI0024254388|nr:HEAT repeat domain-containing protein [Nannocystis sp.]MBK7827335.1 HEAT repeat domain-containing protein [Nannocystis sp.]MBK9754747.1 HEAT repeat domain-containing protein [Nannocystis sp.]